MLFDLSMGDFGWLKVNHLFSMGMQEKHLYFVIIFLGITASYAVIKPVITWFVRFQSVRLLSFLTSSLMVILILFLIVLYVGAIPDIMFRLLKITLQCLAVWGVTIVLYHSLRLVVKNK